MQEWGTPEALGELDRRIYDLAIQPMPLAEIAVRLGVPVGQADERIQHVCRRLGVDGRAGLRAAAELPAVTAATQVRNGSEDEYVIGAETGEPGRRPPKHTRRVVLAGGIATLAIAGGAAAVAVVRRGSSGGRAPGDSGSGTAAPAGSATPAAFGGLPIRREGGLGETYGTATWVNGAPIDWPHGLFSLSLKAGQVSGLRFLETEPRAEGASGFVLYETGPGGTLVWAQHGSGRGYLADPLILQSSWSWPLESLRLVAGGGEAPNRTLVFEELMERRGTGRFHIFALRPGSPLESGPTGAFQLPASGFGLPSLLSRDATRLAIWSGTDSTDPQLHLIDLVRGTIAQSSQKIEPHGGVTARPLRLDRLDGGFDGFLGRWQYPGAEPLLYGQLFNWDGAWAEDGMSRVQELDWTTAYSRDGLRRVSEATLKYVPMQGVDSAREYWTAVSSFGSGQADPEWSMLSASIGYADGTPANPWLADGSGFVAMVRGPEPEGDASDAYEYAIISADGRTVTRIPLPAVPGESVPWFRRNAMRSPSPCPFDANLIAFGRLQVYIRRTGQWLSANVATPDGPDHLDPWASGPGDMVFALPHGGHGGASPPILLNLKRVSGAPPASFRFVVARTGDGLNVRAGPSRGTSVLALLRDGDVVELATDLKFEEGLRSAQQRRDATWLFIRTPAGTSGWVSAAYLDWA